MKNLVILSIAFASVFMFSYRDYGTCDGVEGQKALTCGACHGGSISSDVFILDGKTDEINSGTFVFDLSIPTTGSPAIQIVTASVNDFDQNPKVEVDIANVIKGMNNGRVFSLVSLFEKNGSGIPNKDLSTTFTVQFDEELSEPHTIVVQGVLSNQDGTVFGDRSFYKEVVLEPSNKSGIIESLKANKLDAYYFDHSLFVKNPEPNFLRIIDLEGRVILSSPIDELTEQIDLSNLETGVYYAVFGTATRDIQSLSFKVD